MAASDETLRERLARVEALAACAGASAEERASARVIAERLRGELLARGVEQAERAVGPDLAELERRRRVAEVEVEVQRLRLEWLRLEYERARYREALGMVEACPPGVVDAGEVDAVGWGSGGRFERPGWR